jgi:hypothetical protein
LVWSETGDQADLKPISECNPAGSALSCCKLPPLKRSGQSDDKWDSDGAGTSPMLLPSAEKSRSQLGPPANEENSNSRRSVELVSASCKRRHTQGMKIHRDAPNSLNCVGVDDDTPIQGTLCNKAHRLDSTCLVVSQHQGY